MPDATHYNVLSSPMLSGLIVPFLDAPIADGE